MKTLFTIYFLGLISLCFGCNYGMASDIKVDTISETIEILGAKRTTMVFEEFNLNTGAKVKLWMDPEDGSRVYVYKLKNNDLE